MAGLLSSLFSSGLAPVGNDVYIDKSGENIAEYFGLAQEKFNIERKEEIMKDPGKVIQARKAAIDAITDDITKKYKAMMESKDSPNDAILSTDKWRALPESERKKFVLKVLDAYIKEQKALLDEYYPASIRSLGEKIVEAQVLGKKS